MGLSFLVARSTIALAIGCFTELTSTTPTIAALTGPAKAVHRTAAATYSVLYTFRGGIDGADPVSSVVPDSTGRLYGTTTQGGTGQCTGGCGTVYRLAPSPTGGPAAETVIYRFNGGTDGANPEGTLLIDGNGDVFGTTSAGGSSTCSGGCGTVFELIPKSNGAYSVSILHRFTNNPDGAQPQGTLLADAAGDLFGTTRSGGLSAYGCFGIGQSCGTVFELTKGATAFTENVIYTFQKPADGSAPGPNIVGDGSGTIYGVGVNGGNDGCIAPNYGCGTVFAITPFATGGYGGYVESLLYTLPPPNGTGPFAVGGITRDSRGALYGLQAISPVYPFPSTGAAFKLTPSSTDIHGYTESIIHSFTGIPDGSNPQAAPVADSSGSLYGTTLNGGSSDCNCGTVFKLVPQGNGYAETILYDFIRGADGTYPAAPLYEDASGSLFGTTTSGGSFSNCTAGCGTVFKVTQ